ncbi:probable protein phosphatase 2C 24 [Magnolia sinica]|uniref:probable protein phosphatase 2C 24 n=1 Tax=Magnolia sinica TaxID=86752 RepID=UPI00265A1853|nr:probable protein phosphatase 2C 24 [Magnolia sinica]
MAEICCGVVSESETTAPCETSSRAARRRRWEIRRFKLYAGVAPPPDSGSCKRRKTKASTSPSSSPRDCENASENSSEEELKQQAKDRVDPTPAALDRCPKFGMTSVCGRRRDMEDAVSIHPSFFRRELQSPANLHFFGVYDGHGCSHVAMSCKDKLHGMLAEELGNGDASKEWNDAMGRSFLRMDKEVAGDGRIPTMAANCRCELQTPQCDAVGSTAVVAVVTPEEIVVANCGDSRAVLCRKGKPVPLSSDHKPDRPDELMRIQAAGGRVIYWDGPRVLGVLAMSRAIGDNYLKPFVSSEPEVTVTPRSPDDDCLILASDGLWDVVSNATACAIVRMCLRGDAPIPPEHDAGVARGEGSDKACSDAAMLLTRLALARQSADNVSVVVVDLRSDT